MTIRDIKLAGGTLEDVLKRYTLFTDNGKVVKIGPEGDK